jgi:hypothetical protein
MSSLTIGVAERLRDIVEADIVGSADSVHIAHHGNEDVVKVGRQDLMYRALWLRGNLFAKISGSTDLYAMFPDHLFRANISEGIWLDKVLITGIGCWALEVMGRGRDFMIAATDTEPIISTIINPKGRPVPMSHETGVALCGIIGANGS